jgi:hypothetical protein
LAHEHNVCELFNPLTQHFSSNTTHGREREREKEKEKERERERKRERERERKEVITKQ